MPTVSSVNVGKKLELNPAQRPPPESETGLAWWTKRKNWLSKQISLKLKPLQMYMWGGFYNSRDFCYWSSLGFISDGFTSTSSPDSPISFSLAECHSHLQSNPFYFGKILVQYCRSVLLYPGSSQNLRKNLLWILFSTLGADLNKNNIYHTFQDCPLIFFDSLH